MCMFPFPNNQINSKAYKSGVSEFKCGGCPECLSDRARSWTLRCAKEAEVSPACMVTLTYDDFVRDTRTGRVIGENVGRTDIDENTKKEMQNFLKRLREFFARVKGVKNIKYMLTIEFGKTTHRLHAHAILFNVQFDDLIKYKKSKRGNWIYRSDTLNKLWKHGICTVDSINVTGKVARYCTKYCAKDGRSDGTFMLFSRGIGQKKLLEDFNGVSYIVDGREYPIPRTIWRDYIERKYNIVGYSRYLGLKDSENKLTRLVDKCYSERLSALQSMEYSEDIISACTSYIEAISPKKPRFEWTENMLNAVGSAEDLRSKAVDKYVDSSRLARFYSRKGYWLSRELDGFRTYQTDFKVRSYDLETDTFTVFCGLKYCSPALIAYYRSAAKRAWFSFLRDSDSVYKRYLTYWKRKNELLQAQRLPVRDRILQLPDNKYYGYKQLALQALNKRERLHSSDVVVPPRSNCVSRYFKYVQTVLPFFPSCHKTADDRKKALHAVSRRLPFVGMVKMSEIFPVSVQISLFDET